MTRKPWVGGNFKCNGSKAALESHCNNLNKADFDSKSIDVVVFPVAVHLESVRQKLQSKYHVGLQNISKTNNGAFTGEISAEILKDMGYQYSLVGHSERRQLYGETDAIVAQKVEIMQKNNLFAVICIGETLEERQSGVTEKILEKQLKSFLPKITNFSSVVIAYEPVWAIGTGVVATPEQAQEAHQFIRKFIEEHVNSETAKTLRIAYGGSVAASNCQNLYKQPDIDGFLVGGASLKPEFCDIIESTKLVK